MGDSLISVSCGLPKGNKLNSLTDDLFSKQQFRIVSIVMYSNEGGMLEACNHFLLVPGKNQTLFWQLSNWFIKIGDEGSTFLPLEYFL